MESPLSILLAAIFSTIIILRIRLYSTKSFKHLGTLEYHKDNCQAIAFARRAENSGDKECWLAAGGKDGRISLWKLDFRKH